MTTTTDPLDVLVVGAGQAGLALGRHLHRQGAGFLLVDAGARIGDVWRSRWDSLRLFTAAEHDGQVWFYDPATETVTLRTIFGVNPDPDVDTDNYDGPDNITVSPYGGVILAEDGEGLSHLVGVTEQGKSYPLARNMMNQSEFCGPAFSADGKVLFVNIQSPGHVLAITGPWGRPSNAGA